MCDCCDKCNILYKKCQNIEEDEKNKLLQFFKHHPDEIIATATKFNKLENLKTFIVNFSLKLMDMNYVKLNQNDSNDEYDIKLWEFNNFISYDINDIIELSIKHKRLGELKKHILKFNSKLIFFKNEEKEELPPFYYKILPWNFFFYITKDCRISINK